MSVPLTRSLSSAITFYMGQYFHLISRGSAFTVALYTAFTNVDLRKQK